MAISLEDAAKCGKCGKAGKLDSVFELPDGGHANVYICDNNLCIWGMERSGWVVQTDARGTVFEREIGERGMDKTYPTMTPGLLASGQRKAEDALERDLRND